MRFWFGRKAAPADVRPYVPAWLGAGEQAGFARGYDAQVDEVYRRNPVGQRAVRRSICKLKSQVTVRFPQAGDGGAGLAGCGPMAPTCRLGKALKGIGSA